MSRLVDTVRRQHRPVAAQQAAEQLGSATHCACGGDSVVTDTRPSGTMLRRRRACVVCRERWSTGEVRISSGDGRAVEAAVVDALVIAKIEELLRRMKSARGVK